MLNRVSGKKAEELPMATIIIVIITVLAVAMVLLFVFAYGKTGTQQAETHTGIGAAAADIAACDLWASGLSENFDCRATMCSNATLCRACGNSIDIAGCKMPPGFTGCSDCP